MKQLTLLSILLIIIFTSDSSAQSFKWEAGIEGGAGIRTFRIDPPYPSLLTPNGLCYTAGLSGQYNFDNMWSVKLGAAYERKGTDLEREDINTTGEFNADYISIPLMAKVKFGGKIRFFVNAGPYLGILLSSKTILNAYAGNSEVNIDNDSTTKKIDFGISAGIGIEIPVGYSGAITIEARDNFGLTNISQSRETNAPEIKTNTANLMIGYVFKFCSDVKRKR